MNQISRTNSSPTPLYQGAQPSVFERIANFFRNIGKPKEAPTPVPTMPGDVYVGQPLPPTPPPVIGPTVPVAPVPPPVLAPAPPVPPPPPPPPPPMAPVMTPRVPSGVYPAPGYPGTPPINYPINYPVTNPGGYPGQPPVPGPGGIPGTVPYGVSPIAAAIGLVVGLVSLFKRPANPGAPRPPQPGSPAQPGVAPQPGIAPPPPYTPPTDWSIDLAPNRLPQTPNTAPIPAPRPVPRPVPTYDQDAITWKNGNGFARNQQLGKAMLQSGELLRQLKEYGADKGMPPGALEQWATAHPGLAYKRLQELKRQVALRANR